MINENLQKEVDLRVRAVYDEWEVTLAFIAQQEYREAIYGLTRLQCEAKKLQQTIEVLYQQLSTQKIHSRKKKGDHPINKTAK